MHWGGATGRAQARLTRPEIRGADFFLLMLVYSVVGEAVSYLIPDPVLISDPVYLMILYTSLFAPGRGY